MRGGHLCQEDAARRFDGEVISALVLRGVQVSNAAAERSAITRVEHCIEAEYLGRAPAKYESQSTPSTVCSIHSHQRQYVGKIML